VIFQRSPRNPILTPTDRWWESRSVLNPAAVLFGNRVALVYRAVGADGLSRFGLAWTRDGEAIEERLGFPWYEGAPDDPTARLGVEDPRTTFLDGEYYVTYCKASVESADRPPLSWESAPFRIRTGIGLTADFKAMHEIGVMLPGRNTKDGVLFPARIGGRYAALIRIFPSIQVIYSDDLQAWSEPITVLEPIPGTWEGERVGAGPAPIQTPFGWLLVYHGNAYLELPANRRRYSMGVALLDLARPERVLYRHPNPVLEPEEPYEVQGPVGNVVFGTGMVEIGQRFYLYYGAGDGVICVAWAERAALLDLARAC
jgi:predicted GH43/DUF377 family glycosyl hydrolase